jgi:predicted MPP superfamily phosphohydrolase
MGSAEHLRETVHLRRECVEEQMEIVTHRGRSPAAIDYRKLGAPFMPWNVRILLGFVLLLASSIVASTHAARQPAPSDGPRTIQGVVFDDANRNQTRDPAEAGLSGIVVSDQFSVATTASTGGWQLTEAPNARVVFVSVPDGWTASGAFWRAIPAGTATIEFPLTRRETASEFTFIHASDTHLSAASLPRMKLLRALVEKAKPAFVLITGDLVRDALRVSEAEARGYYDLLVAELKQFPVPVWTVPGNHENFGIEREKSQVSTTHPLYGKQMYRHYLGPNYYSFTWGGIRFLGIDSVDIDDMWYYGHVDAAQLEWIKRDLATAPDTTPVVTFNHIPFASAAERLDGYTEDPPAPTLIRVNGKLLFRHLVSNSFDVLAALRPHRLEIALGGHLHTREVLEYQTEEGLRRFHQAGAVVGSNETGGQKMSSGVTLYRVRAGVVDGGTFLPL